MSTPDPTPTSLPAAPDWRAFCAAVLDDIDTGTAVDIDAVADRLRAALATPPAVDGDERLRLVTAGVCSGYIAGHDATVEGHYGDPDEVAAEMAPMVLAEVGATPPAATREAEHDDGDDAIDRWVDSKSDWISNWGAPRSDIAALIGEALEHWGNSTTHEAGPLPQAPPTEEDLYDLAEVFNGDPVPVSERPWEQPGWCDAEGRCWFGSERDGCIQAVWSMRMPIQRISHQRWCAPHWALPVPAAAAGEVQSNG
jgi:hypothetical protein